MTSPQLVSDYMTTEVETVGPATRLPDIARTFERWNISAVPITDPSGHPIGVVSRSDLLRVARRTGALGRESVALMVPDLPAVAVMTREVQVIGRHTYLADAAGRMWNERIHRLFVTHNGCIVGVLSVADVAAAVRDNDDATPIGTIMTSPIVTIETHERVTVALERLTHARVTGLVVVEDGWPVGMFTQIEALAARGMPDDTRVDDVFDQALICLPATTRVCRAAGQIAQLDVRRVVVSRDREAVGVVTALDLARLISAPARAA